MNNIRLIKQRVCFAIFFVGICFTAIGHFDNSMATKTTPATIKFTEKNKTNESIKVIVVVDSRKTSVKK
jgi:hypothetical protein